VLASFVTAMLVSNFIANAYCLGLLHPVGGVASIRTTWVSDIMGSLFSFLPMETSIINLGGAPFINRVHFSPLLAFAMSVILFCLPAIKCRKLKFFALVISISFLYSLIETEGRTGQILFLFFLLSGIMYKYRSWKSFFLAAFFIFISLLLLYSFSGRFNSRVNDIFRGWDSFQQGEFGYGIGDRLIYTVSGWKLFLESPVFGHGTSSFTVEYARIKAELFPDTLDSGNPHSQYILVLVQFGLLGLISLLWIFYEGFCIFKRRLGESDDFYNLWALWLLLMYLLTGFVGTCLWDSPLQHFFILFVSVFFFRETERTFHVTSGR
jgi:O-antigen ligase